MCKIKLTSGASLRSELQAFEIDAIKHAVDHGMTKGTSYNFGKLGTMFTILDKDSQTITVRREPTEKFPNARTFTVYYGQAAEVYSIEQRNVGSTTPTASAPAPAASAPASTDPYQALLAAAAALRQQCEKKAAPAIDEAAVSKIVAEQVAAKVAEITRQLEEANTTRVQINTAPAVKIEGKLHPKFKQVLSCVKHNIPAYLFGPAGTGKTTLAKQVAKSLNLDFYCVSALQFKNEFEGFIDGYGKYQITDFYRAFTGGGVFMLDEIDSTASEVLVAFNNALANGFYTFPGEIGKVEAHKDFRIIAAGNTIGLGADSAYNGRFQLDASTRDRFAFVKVEYIRDIEAALARNDYELVDFMAAARVVIAEQGLNATASPRAIDRIATFMADGDSIETALALGLTNSWAPEDLCLLRANMVNVDIKGFNSKKNKYYKAMCNL